MKIMKYLKSAPTCFGSQSVHHQGGLIQCLAKINKRGSIVPLTWTWPVLWRHIVTGCACVRACV